MNPAAEDVNVVPRPVEMPAVKIKPTNPPDINFIVRSIKVGEVHSQKRKAAGLQDSTITHHQILHTNELCADNEALECGIRHIVLFICPATVDRQSFDDNV